MQELAPSVLIVFPTHLSQLFFLPRLYVPAEQGSVIFLSLISIPNKLITVNLIMIRDVKHSLMFMFQQTESEE